MQPALCIHSYEVLANVLRTALMGHLLNPYPDQEIPK